MNNSFNSVVEIIASTLNEILFKPEAQINFENVEGSYAQFEIAGFDEIKCSLLIYTTPLNGLVVGIKKGNVLLEQYKGGYQSFLDGNTGAFLAWVGRLTLTKKALSEENSSLKGFKSSLEKLGISPVGMFQKEDAPSVLFSGLFASRTSELVELTIKYDSSKYLSNYRLNISLFSAGSVLSGAQLIETISLNDVSKDVGCKEMTYNLVSADAGCKIAFDVVTNASGLTGIVEHLVLGNYLKFLKAY